MSPVDMAVSITGTLMRMTSASIPSSLKKPFFTAILEDKKLRFGLVTPMRILSAAWTIAAKLRAKRMALRARQKIFCLMGCPHLYPLLEEEENKPMRNNRKN